MIINNKSRIRWIAKCVESPLVEFWKALDTVGGPARTVDNESPPVYPPVRFPKGCRSTTVPLHVFIGVPFHDFSINSTVITLSKPHLYSVCIICI